MKEKFFGNIFLLLAINLLIKPLYLFGVDAQVQNQVGTTTYGVYFSLINFTFLFLILLDPGFHSYNSKSIAADRASVKDYFPNAFGLKLLLSCAFLMMVNSVAFFVFPEIHLEVLLYISVFQILSSMYMYLRSHFSALGYYKKDAILSGLDKLLMILLIGGYMLYYTIDIIVFLRLQILAMIVCIIIATIILRKEVNLLPRFNIQKIKPILTSSIPYALVFLLMTIYTKIDGIMLERMLDDGGYQAGVYAAGYRLLDAANMIGYLFAALLIPMYSVLLSKKESPQLLSDQAIKVVAILISGVVLISVLYSNELMQLIYVHATEDFGKVMRILILSFVAVGISYIYGSLVSASGKLLGLNILFGVGVVINIVLNIYLIPISGALGAAKATLVTQVLMMIGQIAIARNLFGLHINVGTILHIVAVVFVTILFDRFVAQSYLTHWMMSLVATGLFLIAAFIGSRFITKKDILF